MVHFRELHSVSVISATPSDFRRVAYIPLRSTPSLTRKQLPESAHHKGIISRTRLDRYVSSSPPFSCVIMIHHGSSNMDMGSDSSMNGSSMSMAQMMVSLKVPRAPRLTGRYSIHRLSIRSFRSLGHRLRPPGILGRGCLYSSWR